MPQVVLRTNKNTALSFLSPFREVVIITRLTGSEGISTLFDIEVELCSRRNNLPFQDILGKQVTVAIQAGREKRYINGVVSEFYQGETILTKTKQEETFYKARIVPLLWQTTLNQTCCIYQKLSYVDIIKKILGKYHIPFKDHVQNSGKQIREMTVQFDETDFQFLSRLMEAAGICYFFAHEKNKHTMVLGDLPGVFEPLSRDPIIFLRSSVSGKADFGIETCFLTESIVTSSVAVKDFNFETPRTNLFAKTEGRAATGQKYFYPGHYWTGTQEMGEKISKVWLEGEEAQGQNISGSSTVPFMTAGRSFFMENHPRRAMNKAVFVLKDVHHHFEIEPSMIDEIFNLENDEPQGVYQNTFVAFPKAIPYRPQRKAPWPKMTTQTAIVTGKAGEEIWTDKYGRVFVKFHWDVGPTTNDKTSCWVRVMQPWTGNKWGALFIPRVGQEVVIHFLDGNPDNPIITGCVYNHDNMPPYLPGQPTVSTIKTNSSKGGGGFNELRFDDKKKEEQIYIHAQKNMDTVVEHNQTVTLTKGDRTLTLKEGNEVIALKKGKRTTTVEGGDEIHKNEKNFSHTVGGNYTLKVTGNHETVVGGHCTLKVTGKITIETTNAIEIKAVTGITAKSSTTVMVKGGAGIMVKSGASLMMEGGASALIKGGAVCIVKGAIVQVNP